MNGFISATLHERGQQHMMNPPSKVSIQVDATGGLYLYSHIDLHVDGHYTDRPQSYRNKNRNPFQSKEANLHQMNSLVKAFRGNVLEVTSGIISRRPQIML
jgi:hypothetical protein